MTTEHSPDYFRVDRTAIQVASHEEAELSDREYWLSQTPERRLQHLEALRELNYGSKALNQRFQRVLTVLERPQR